VCARLDDKVVDSRTTDDGSAIRRRRECLSCGQRFTTFERLELEPLIVVKRSGDRVPFDRERILAGVDAAAKGRPLTPEQVDALADEVEQRYQGRGEVSSEQIGLAVLERLRGLDDVAYVRFASVYKGFAEAADFERELSLLTKATEPKRH
jgi:transcriptional repressor NrdR